MTADRALTHTAPLLLALAAGGCAPTDVCVHPLKGKVLHYGEGAESVSCVCDGPDMMTCIAPICGQADRGPWCVELSGESAIAGEYAFDFRDLVSAGGFCQLDVGEDPRLLDIADDPTLPPVDCAQDSGD